MALLPSSDVASPARYSLAFRIAGRSSSSLAADPTNPIDERLS